MMRLIVLFIVSFTIVLLVHIVLAAPDLPDISENPGTPNDSPDRLFPSSIMGEMDDASVGASGGSVNFSDYDHISNDTNISATNPGGDYSHKEDLVNIISSINDSKSDADPVGGDGSTLSNSPDIALKKGRSMIVLIIALLVIIGLLMFTFLTRKEK